MAGANILVNVAVKASSVGLDRFQLVELRYDDGIQTYHAREVATSRPVQVHLFAEGQTRDTLALMSKLGYLPEHERRRVIDRGVHEGVPYLVTERLAGFASLREWIDRTSEPTVDEQFAMLFEEEPAQEPAPVEQFLEPVTPPKRGWKSVLGLALGVVAALVFLVVLVALFAFRPHQF